MSNEASTSAASDPWSVLPKELVEFLNRAKTCDVCKGPYFDSYISVIELRDIADAKNVPVETRKCWFCKMPDKDDKMKE